MVITANVDGGLWDQLHAEKHYLCYRSLSSGPEFPLSIPILQMRK